MKSGGLQTYKMFSALGHIDLIPNYGTLAQDDFPKKKEKNVTENILIHMKKTGIATHICTLVSYDSPTDDWASVYVHSKLMIVDHDRLINGSANINLMSIAFYTEIAVQNTAQGN